MSRQICKIWAYACKLQLYFKIAKDGFLLCLIKKTSAGHSAGAFAIKAVLFYNIDS